MMEKVAVHLLIRGKVQGVWYRAWLAGKAGGCMGGAGWVRNLKDGRVEAHIEGPKQVVETLVGLCHQGSPLAIVDEVIRADAAVQNFEKFEVRDDG